MFSKRFSLFTSLVVFSCMMGFYFQSGYAYTTNENQVWYPANAKGGPYQNCKIRAQTQYNDLLKKECSSLSGTSYTTCVNRVRGVLPKLLNACDTTKSQYNMYVARNTPIDILNGIIDPNDVGTQTYGRTPFDGTNFYKINYALDSTLLQFYRSGYKYKPVGTYTVEFNGATYVMAGFHFHKPSEHTWEGAFSGMEIHFVHILLDGPQNGRLEDPDKYLVLGFMLEEFDTATNCPGDISNVFDGAISQNSYVEWTITPRMVSRIYSYEGGLTTYPYTTRVRWTLSPYWQSSATITSWPGNKQEPKDLYPKTTRLGYPDRPPVRALASDVMLLDLNSANEGYYYNGCHEP